MCSEPEPEEYAFSQPSSESEIELPNDPNETEHKRTRLLKKTMPCNALGYPQRPLLKLTEVKIARAKLKIAQREQKFKFKRARLKALELLAAQPEIGDGEIDIAGHGAAFALPHPTHRIVTFQGDDTTIFCKYSGWSSRSRTRLKLLNKPCLALKEGNRSQLRLLECGILLAPGAWLPPKELKPRARRRKRWW